MVGWVTPSAQAADSTYQLGSYVAEPVTTQGQTFFTGDLYINKTGDSIVVSGSADGTAPFYVDDLLIATAFHPDGSTASTTIDDSNGCTATTILTTPRTNIARFLENGVNRVRITFKDACGGNYGNSDIWITGTADISTTPPAPQGPRLAAGWFNGVVADATAVKPKKATANIGFCTAGFAVTKNGSRYMLTSNHCRNWVDAKERQLSAANPVDVVSDEDKIARVTWANALDCSGRSPRCLQPTGKPYDIMAWKPDPNTVTPTGYAQTGVGLLPVLGNSDWTHGQTVCRFGIKTNREKCGRVGRYDQGSKYVSMRDFDGGTAVPGDSGGPVYAYVYSGAGDRIGVTAVGITEAHDDKGNTYFLPIATVLRSLGVSILTVP